MSETLNEMMLCASGRALWGVLDAWDSHVVSNRRKNEANYIQLTPRCSESSKGSFWQRRISKEIQPEWPFNSRSKSFPKFFISTNRIEATDRPQCTLEHISNSLQSHISHLHLWYGRKNDIYLFSNNNLTTILQFMNWIELLCIFGINYLAIRLHNRNSMSPLPLPGPNAKKLHVNCSRKAALRELGSFRRWMESDPNGREGADERQAKVKVSK